MSIISTNMISIRKHCGYKQIEVAKAIEISPQRYSKYEKDERTPALEIVVKLSEYYKVPILYFFTNRDEINNINTTAYIADLAITIDVQLVEAKAVYTSFTQLRKVQSEICKKRRIMYSDTAEIYSLILEFKALKKKISDNITRLEFYAREKHRDLPHI